MRNYFFGVETKKQQHRESRRAAEPQSRAAEPLFKTPPSKAQMPTRALAARSASASNATKQAAKPSAEWSTAKMVKYLKVHDNDGGDHSAADWRAYAEEKLAELRDADDAGWDDEAPNVASKAAAYDDTAPADRFGPRSPGHVLSAHLEVAETVLQRVWPFGKYEGMTVGQINKIKPGYWQWCVANVRATVARTRGCLRSLLPKGRPLASTLTVCC